MTVMKFPSRDIIVNTFSGLSSQKGAVSHVREFLKGLCCKGDCVVLPGDTPYSKIVMLVTAHFDVYRKFPGMTAPVAFLIYKKRGVVSLAYRFEDNDYQDISWVECAKCLSRTVKQLTANTMSQHERHVIKALRAGISDQIVQFRAKHVSAAGQDVDHYPISFKTLSADWISTVGTIDDIDVRDLGFDGWVMNDREQLQSWQQYHAQHAKLRMLDHHLNMKQWQPDYVRK